MAEFYKVLKADAMGDPYTPSMPGAKPIQSYWCQVEGQEKAVMIGKQVRDDGQPALVAGQHVYGNLMYAKSQKGTEYWKFKGEKVPDGVTRPAESPAQATAQQAVGTRQVNMSSEMPDWFKPISNQIDYIFRELRKMDDNPSVSEAAYAEEAKLKALEESKPEQVTDGALDEATKAVLDDIFGPSPEPEATDTEDA